MSRRGVFCILFLLHFCSTAVACQLVGEVQGTYENGGFQHELSLGLKKEWSKLKLAGNWQAKWANSPRLVSQNLAWRGDFGPLTVLKNQSHFTSDDLFCLIHKDNFGPETRGLFVNSSGLRFGLVHKIPFKNQDFVDGWFCSSNLELGALAIQGTQLKFSGYSESGQAQVLQVKGTWDNYQISAGHGWQIDSSGQQWQARLAEMQKKAGFVEGTFTWQWVEPGFLSPLAKTNKLTPDRQGWKIETKLNLNQGILLFTRRSQSNFAASKNYNQLSWKFTTADQKRSVLWRLEPTTAFILTAETGQLMSQLDFLNGIVRLDYQNEQLFTGFRWDLERQIVRLELKFQQLLAWRIIGKYDFLQQRKYYYLAASKSSKSVEVKVELGTYDRGNLLSGFNQNSGVSISWGWKF